MKCDMYANRASNHDRIVIANAEFRCEIDEMQFEAHHSASTGQIVMKLRELFAVTIFDPTVYKKLSGASSTGSYSVELKKSRKNLIGKCF